jgi:hypothetical protein
MLKAGYAAPVRRGERIRKCAATHRVERLIHLELEDRFGRKEEKKCRCGKTHREWFQAGTQGWAGVREVIVRWMAFAENEYGEVE